MAWSNYTLCTVGDIRARFKSPEVPIALTKADDTLVGFTASGNVLTTGVPHQLLSWNQIQFATTGSLPSPIVAGTTYYAIVLSPTTLSVATVIGGSAITLTTTGTGTNTLQNVTLNNVIQEKIVIAKRWMYSWLQVEMQNRVPMLVRRWMNRKRSQLDYFAQNLRREFELLAKTATVPIVPGVYDGSVIDLYMLLSMTQGLVPRTFTYPGPPISGPTGLYAGQAEPGSVYIDTQFDRMYFNRGSLASPIWVRPTVEFVLDNILNANAGRIQTVTVANGGSGYNEGDVLILTGGNSQARIIVVHVNAGAITDFVLINAGVGYSTGTVPTTGGSGSSCTFTINSLADSVLLDAAIDYTLWAMAQDGMVRNRVSVGDPAAWSYGVDLESVLKKRAEQRLKQALPLLNLDIDGDGVISDFEADLTHEPIGVFA